MASTTAVPITDARFEHLVEMMRQERRQRLSARSAHYEIEREPGGWIVRNPRVPGRIDLVNDAGQCTCQRFAVWDYCRHLAIVEVREETFRHRRRS